MLRGMTIGPVHKAAEHNEDQAVSGIHKCHKYRCSKTTSLANKYWCRERLLFKQEPESRHGQHMHLLFSPVQRTPMSILRCWPIVFRYCDSETDGRAREPQYSAIK